MGPSYDDTRPAWDMLEERVEAFAAAWAAQPEPSLKPFLPGEPPALRRMVLIELIKADLEQRVSHGRPIRKAEDYAAEFSELSRDSMPCDLLYEEFFVRKRIGEDVQLEEYQQRFPAQATELARLVDGSSTYQSTTLIAPRSSIGFQIGDVVDDFDLKAQLGEGAFAKVFLAYQRSMQRLVALKISADRGVEPQTLAQLNHPNIVRVFDQRRIPQKNQRLLYMEFLAGGTLHDILAHVRTIPKEERTGAAMVTAIDKMLERRGADKIDSSARRLLESATWPQAVAWIGARLADALAAAHSRGVLHRDIKPANVLLGADASPRLADFNVGFCSKVEGATPHSFFGGSLVYMSPEQMEAYNPAHERSAADLDARSDIYSLGVTLWELLTGERPFADDRLDGAWSVALLAVTNRRRGGLAPKAYAAVPRDCPDSLMRTLVRCLDSDPAKRFADAAGLARVLDLTLYPRTQKLLDPPTNNWRRVARRWPLCAMLAAGLIPNILAGWFNFTYNFSEVITRDGATVGLREAFPWIQMCINGLAFPLGVVLFIVLARPVLGALRNDPQGTPLLPDDELAKLRRHTLMLGHYGVRIGVGLWLGASIMYPLLLRWRVPDLPGAEFRDLFMHFLASLAVCGLIAAAYPFFLGSALGTSAFYPTFVRPGTTTPYDAADLASLERALWPHLALAAAVPLVGVAALVLVDTRQHWPMLTLCGSGLLGLVMAVALMKHIQRDIADLLPAVSPGDPRVDSMYSSRG
jgi:eukaryotic-like serine/threonine-protein kinase